MAPVIQPTLSFPRLLRRAAGAAGLALAVATGAVTLPAHAQDHLSEASAMSALPVALSVAAPVGLLAAGGQLSVVAVQAGVDGSTWVLERASDGARMSVHLGGRALSAVGTQVAVVALASGWVLAGAGQALCFIPNELGATLMHHTQVTP